LGFNDLYILETQPSDEKPQDGNPLASSNGMGSVSAVQPTPGPLSVVEDDFSQNAMLDEQVSKLQMECNKLRDDLNQCYIKIDQLCGKNLNGLTMQELDLLEKNYFDGLRRISLYRKEKLQQEYERKLQQQREELEQKIAHIEQREQQTATQLQQRVYILEQELERSRSSTSDTSSSNTANGNNNTATTINSIPTTSLITANRGVIGDRRSKLRSSTEDEESATLGGLNLSGSLGLISGLGLNNSNPLSMSTGILEEDTGIRYMVEHLQGEVTKLQSDNLKLRRRLKDNGLDAMDTQKVNNVGFAFVKTREFIAAQGLGVPSVGSAPLGLGFTPTQEDTEELLEGYEKRRETERKGVSRIPEEERKSILLESGASEESLEEGARQLNLLNWGRLESMASPTENPLPEHQRQHFRKFLFQP